jgi:AmmeMemoRadiSam system protein A
VATLDPNQRTRLLQIARESIASVFDRRVPEIDLTRYDEVLRRPSGAFVTLEKHGQLRGCIGSIQAVAPLVQAVSTSAINAAFRDPRFMPVAREELSSLHIEISVMSPIVVVTDVAEIEVGRDGLIISKAGRTGLLLPQVATEHGWDRDTFLRHTCLKAGLPPEAWQTGECRIERFSAEVFGE